MTAVSQLDEDFNSGGSSSGSSSGSSGGSGSSGSSGSSQMTAATGLTIAFKQSCGAMDAYCWLYGQVIRFMDDSQDEALIHVFAPVHMLYYNVVSATHNRRIVTVACISLKASRANVLMAAPSNIEACYSYHPAAAQPVRKRSADAGKQHNGRRRMSAASVLLSPSPSKPQLLLSPPPPNPQLPPPPKPQMKRKDEDIEIDFDQDFAFMPVANESAANCFELNLDQCSLDDDNDGITEEELLALFNASSTPVVRDAAVRDAAVRDADGRDADGRDADASDDDLTLPVYARDEHCNGGDDDVADDADDI